VSNEDYKYLLDTDVFVRICELTERQKIFDRIIGMADAGRVNTIRQVFGELKKWPIALGMLKPHRSIFEVKPEDQYTTEVQAVIDELGNKARWLWEQTGTGNPDPADPWLIGVAKTLGYTVVTNEGQRKEKRIPAACRFPTIDCRCITGPHFLVEVDIVQVIKPEWIDTDAFFKKGE
jgi:Domain of unknown function (DUF4411)